MFSSLELLINLNRDSNFQNECRAQSLVFLMSGLKNNPKYLFYLCKNTLIFLIFIISLISNKVFFTLNSFHT